MYEISRNLYITILFIKIDFTPAGQHQLDLIQIDLLKWNSNRSYSNRTLFNDYCTYCVCTHAIRRKRTGAIVKRKSFVRRIVTRIVVLNNQCS